MCIFRAHVGGSITGGTFRPPAAAIGAKKVDITLTNVTSQNTKLQNQAFHLVTLYTLQPLAIPPFIASR